MNSVLHEHKSTRTAKKKKTEISRDNQHSWDFLKTQTCPPHEMHGRRSLGIFREKAGLWKCRWLESCPLQAEFWEAPS